MKVVRRKWSVLYQSDYFPFFVLLILEICLHLSFDLNYGDDLKFKTILQHNDLFSWLYERYIGWSSRVVLEGVMVAVLYVGDWLWKTIDVLMIVTFAFSLSKLFLIENKNRRTGNWLIVALFFLIPSIIFNDAGWGATTLNYFWPLTLGIVSLLPVKKLLQSEPINWYEGLLCSLALIFASSQEQMCVALLIVYGGLFLYMAVFRRFHPFMLTQCLIAFASFVFIAVSPGNKARLMIQVTREHHDFLTLPLIKKVEIGFSSTFNPFIFHFDPIFVVLCFLVLVGVFANYHDWMLRLIGTIPLFCTLAFGAFGTLTADLFPQISKRLIHAPLIPYGYVRLDNVWSYESYLPIAVFGLVFLCLLLSLLYILEDFRVTLLVVLVLFAGFMSHMVPGFTPSVWGSGIRTFMFMYASLIIAIIVIYQKLASEISPRLQQTCALALTLLTGLVFLNDYLL